MNTTTITDENYKMPESLLTSDGRINSAVIKNKNFKNLAVYKYIIENTHALDIFEKIEFKHRLLFLTGGAKIEHCGKCGKPYIYFRKAQRRFSLCGHHDTDPAKHSAAISSAKTAKFEKFIETLDGKSLRLDEKTYDDTLRRMAGMPNNYAFIITKNELQDFYHDLILKTADIIPVDKNNLAISKRIYLECNSMTAEPVCGFCGKNKTIFINRIKGYSDSCSECSKIKSDATRSLNIKQAIDEDFNFDKYEIIKYPSLLNYDSLVIKCRKCGKTSDIFINNGKISEIKNRKLCRHCECKADWEETKFHEFISSIYDGKIVHGKDSMKIIPPYQLDEYIPELKLAFEYDGLYWHSEQNGKDAHYHLAKTSMCEKAGIQLIHVFSNEWLFKNEITKSRIKNLFGIYDKTVFARKCSVEELPSDKSRIFQNDNHIQGYANSSVSIGLFFDNELISLMTFGKCRFDKKHEWELVRFCNKLGYHIPGAAGKLLKYFEKTYSPRSLVTYADRRWSVGKLYFALGFSFVHASNPNYWYFNNHSVKLLSRINFQKHKLKDKLEKFDPDKSEAENMKDNGYYRIFDCGNMVFEKIY